MSNTNLSETETLLPTSPSAFSPSAFTPDPLDSLANGGRDIPTHIDAFYRNVRIWKSLAVLGVLASLTVEVWGLVDIFRLSQHSGGHESAGVWAKAMGIFGLMLTSACSILLVVSVFRPVRYNRPTQQMTNLTLHRIVTQVTFSLILVDILAHIGPIVVTTSKNHHAPTPLHTFRHFTLLQLLVLLATLISIGRVRRGPRLHFEPMKLATGFGLNKQEVSKANDSKLDGVAGEELKANVLDRDECSILGFLFFSYASAPLRRSMKVERLEFEDLPHLAEEIRTSGYRATPGRIRLDNDKAADIDKHKKVTAWSLVRETWRGRGYIVLSNMVFEGLSHVFGMAQLVVLRELIDTFAQPMGSDKSYAFILCGVLLLSHAMSVIISATTWVRENYLLHLPVRMTLSSILFSKIMRITDVKTAEAHNTNSDEVEAELERNKGRAQIVNLLTGDAGSVAALATHCWNVTNNLIDLSFGLWLLYSMLGISAIIGIASIPVLALLTARLSKAIYHCDRASAQATDARIGAIKEFLMGIKVIKLNAFEPDHVRNITEYRDREVKIIRYRYTLGTLWNILGDQLPVIAIMITFIFHTKVMKQPLTASTAFVALSVFNTVKSGLSFLPGFIQDLLRAKVAIDRLVTFLNRPEIDYNEDNTSDDRVICRQATIGWPTEDPSDRTPAGEVRPFVLENLDFEIPQSKLTIVIGPLGSGKTLLLRGILGEAQIASGTVIAPRTSVDAVPLNADEIDRTWSTSTWLTNSVAYAPQQPYIRHGTIRDNILFGQPMWTERYEETLRQAALLSDLAILPEGDMTEVGEQGVTLSGGQKARVNLARCIYSRAKTVYMDDILSAVDAHTVQYIYKECLKGSLLKDRTVLLVTHHVGLCLPAAQYVVSLQDGKVTQAGPADVHDLVAIDPVPDLSLQTEKVPEGSMRRKSTRMQPADEGKKRQIYEDEHRDTGRVAISHYRLLLSSAGGWGYWSIFAFIFVMTTLADIGRSFVLKRWSADDDPTHLDGNWIMYDTLVTAGVLLGSLRWVWLYGVGNVGFSNSATRKVHAMLLSSLAGATMGFFEKTPTGRMINIFGQDTARLDVCLSDDFGRSIMTSLDVFASMLIVCLQAPSLALVIIGFGLPLYWLSGILGKFRSDIRRIGATAGSPLISLYHDAIEGTVMIRAFGSTEYMQAVMLAFLNRDRQAGLADWTSYNWVRMIIQVLTSFLIGATAYTLVLTDISPSQAGFILSFAISASGGLFGLLERYSYLEQTLVSAERVNWYIQNPAQEKIEGDVPEKQWPSEGAIEVKDLRVRYAPDLPEVLHGLSFSVEAGTRVGLVGATGSGKSTLALSLFRAIELDSGSIKIDGLDVTKIALQELRGRLNMVAQDGSLGSGTLRHALDVSKTKDDYEIYQALRRIHLLPESDRPEDLKDNPFANLDTFVAMEGANFSHGQRQLLCLARALLKKSKVLVMDEATSSVDFEMDTKITATIKECFAGTTMLVIAHRLATIMDYDSVLVLDKGRIIEQGRPADLARQEGSAFHGLCMAQGEEEYEKLLTLAS